MKNKNKLNFLLCYTLLIMLSCENRNNRNNAKVTNILRFDKDLLSFDNKQFDSSESIMIKKYGDLYPFYIQNLLGIGSIDKSDLKNYYKNNFIVFLSSEYKSIEDSIINILDKQMPQIEKDLYISIENYKSLIDKSFNPKIYSFFISPNGVYGEVTAFSYGSDTFGINLFHFLGKDFSIYKTLYSNQGYSYMTEWKDPKYIVRNVFLSKYDLLTEKNIHYNELIYNMIEEGKKYYFLEKIAPFLSDNTKIGYTKAQYEWCHNNEVQIWTYFVENKLLYDTDNLTSRKYTKEGPTSAGMPKESPGMVGSWLGWQIVKKYVENTNTPLDKLLYISPKEILKLSNYKPTKKESLFNGF